MGSSFLPAFFLYIQDGASSALSKGIRRKVSIKAGSVSIFLALDTSNLVGSTAATKSTFVESS
jgi:hypothetical protein